MYLAPATQPPTLRSILVNHDEEGTHPDPIRARAAPSVRRHGGSIRGSDFRARTAPGAGSWLPGLLCGLPDVPAGFYRSASCPGDANRLAGIPTGFRSHA